MSDPFTKPVVVIDNGSYNIKAGFACDNHPVSIFRTTVGRPKFLQGTYGKVPYEVYIGDEAVERQDDLDLNYPVVRGKITHWDNMERVWHHIFYRELKAAPEDRAVLLSCAPATTMVDKAKCCEVFFEALNAPALCVKPQSVLALFGSGFTTGLSVDLGFLLTEIHPVYEGGSVSYANMTTKIAGQDLSNYMQGSFEKRGLQLSHNANDVIEDLLKNYLYVTKDGTMSRKESLIKYKLPSGEEIDVNEEVYNAGEMYFQPEKVLGKTDGLPIQEAIVTAVLKCDPGLQPEMYTGIVTHGGLGTMRGLNKRLSREISAIIQRPIKIKNSSELYALAWLGGAVFSGIVEARKAWVTKKQFQEYGEKIIRNRVKCCEIFFETLNAPALCVKPQSFLALFGSGFTTGLSVDLGEDITEVNPIYEGGSITYANMVTNVAGNEIKNWMKERLESRGYDLGSPRNCETVVNDLWSLLYVTPNCEDSKSERKKVEYKLPNGQVVDVSDEVFLAGEMYFQPEWVLGYPSDKMPIHEAVVTSILKVDKGLQPGMYDSIVTHGGLLTIPGFNKRLSNEISKIIQRHVSIPETTESYACAWMGGSVFAEMSGNIKLWVTKKQFEEYGAKIVRNKFL